MSNTPITDYRSPMTPDDPPGGVAMLFLGLLCGLAISGIGWLLLHSADSLLGLYFLAGVAITKLVVWIIFRRSPRTKFFAFGVIISLLIGCLVLFGICVAAFRNI